MGGTVINGKVFNVPGHGNVVVQARAMLRLGALGLVTCEEHHEEIAVYQGHCFGRLGGKRTYYRHTVFSSLTDAGRAALAAVVALAA